ncbi:hypothetical protein NIBR502772_04250 [Pseudarthrobacter sp. NIBRBAC000502772]|uniref:VOC family protein n=1 Tax=Pseudarthrobacter sp. NIBRBAC000502772 TaxID=2590775 RepID=UPI0011303AFF|nr:hypothetical protein [Pseudarthrobacter sp. NIBRBAC000502772]QDG65532.1 hypothetical protein NIBR502772_04250 [Pseudarthrobacter sp. NIBRBAC000502772]
MAGEPAFFEIGVEDPERGRAFYGALFGWDFSPGPSDQGGSIIGTPGNEDPAEYGRFKLCKDDQGSTFGLHQPPAP